MRQLARAGGLAGAVVLALAAPAAGQVVSFRNGHGITVQSVTQLDPRLLALELGTTALPKPIDLRILLPSGYAAHPRRRYPVLYLFDGTSGRASDWTTMGGAEQTTAGLPLIVVMPNVDLDGDGGGWCTNWPDGRYDWETFHIQQLIPFIDQNLRTRRSRSQRAIAGLSQGGFCSISYAAQFPQLFGVALAYSGAPEIAFNPLAQLGAMTIINATEVALDGVAPDSMFGNPVSDYLNWAAHDPATLASNLRATKLYLYFGNGLPGPLDSSPNPEAMGIEALINADNNFFHQRLRELGIQPAVYDPYGNGTHSWPYWARDLRWSIGPIMSDFAHPPPPPRAFSYTSDAFDYSLYGWSVALRRLVAELSTLRVTGPHSFALQGSGSATVTTPAAFAREERYSVSIHAADGSSRLTLSAGRDRRLRIPVALGPSDRTREYSLGGPPLPSPGTHTYKTIVSITREVG
jgi:S-formylglutathione hydrolase FrmB